MLKKTIIQQMSFKDQIQKILIERMLSGELQPGEQLKELSLAREFGTSQAPVREALRTLESSGYLEHRLHRGTIVRVMQLKEIADSLRVKEALESQALTDGLTRLQENLGEWMTIEQDVKAASNQNQIIPFLKFDALFHQMIVKACDNNVMLSLWDTLSNQLQIMLVQQLQKIKLETIDLLHDPIIKAVEKGNAREAERQLHNHYLEWEKIVGE